MEKLVFVKFGGSLITDKAQEESLREGVLRRVAAEVAEASARDSTLRLVVGHGSGSFGHVAAARFQTASGAAETAEWHGFAEVSDAAARLNAIVRAALRQAGVPALTLQPSASAVCGDGVLEKLAYGPVRAALEAGLVPLVYGDVAFDRVQGSAIISTEQILSFLARHLRPQWLLLAGETAGVLDDRDNVIPSITPRNLAAHRPALGGSRGTDVTGGMLTKVEQMLELVQAMPGVRVRIFSGLEPGALAKSLSGAGKGTVISQGSATQSA
ncbi:MAG: isopentenyl phosphate kinase [Candidatus Promineifilaceae bacterium]|nr:isopentenyl phosphate kinase [Candidatus Promineifilaceae bacterium]